MEKATRDLRELNKNMPLMNTDLERRLGRRAVVSVVCIEPVSVSKGERNRTTSSVMSLRDAAKRAVALDVDLVGITEERDIVDGRGRDGSLVVVRCAKWKSIEYEKKQAEKITRRENKVKSEKETKFKVGIGDNDRDMKVEKMIDMMAKGHPVKITITARKWELNKEPELVRDLQKIIFAKLEGLVTKEARKLPGDRQTNYQVSFTPLEGVRELYAEKKQREKEEEEEAKRLEMEGEEDVEKRA
jgi:translation initiation factor IF-3